MKYTFERFIGTLLWCFCLATHLSAQTTLWDFETPARHWWPDNPNWGSTWEIEDGKLTWADFGGMPFDAVTATPEFISRQDSVPLHGDVGSFLSNPILTFVLSANLPFEADSFLATLIRGPIDNPIETIDLLDFSFNTDWHALDASDGEVDNSVRITQPIETNAVYRIRFRTYDYDLEPEGYTIGVDDIAVTNGEILDLRLRGDIDQDLITGGRDFLGIQRNAGSLDSASELKNWQIHYGKTLPPVTFSIPEPSIIYFALVAGSYLLLSRKT